MQSPAAGSVAAAGRRDVLRDLVSEPRDLAKESWESLELTRLAKLFPLVVFPVKETTELNRPSLLEAISD